MKNISNSIKNSSLSDKNTSKSKKKRHASDSSTKTDYRPDSYWSNVLYGIGMLAFLLISVIIPDITAKMTAIGLYSIIIGTYTVALLFNVIRTKKSARYRKRTPNH